MLHFVRGCYQGYCYLQVFLLCVRLGYVRVCVLGECLWLWLCGVGVDVGV